MPYSVMKNPSVQIDLMVLEKYWPKLAGALDRTGCKYASETRTKKVNGNTYVVIRDIQADRNDWIGEALALFFGLEWYYLTDKQSEKPGKDNFYILIRPRRKGRRRNGVQKNREETGAGSESGNTGESGTVQSGQSPEHCGSGDLPDHAGTDSIHVFEVRKDKTYSSYDDGQ